MNFSKRIIRPIKNAFRRLVQENQLDLLPVRRTTRGYTRKKFGFDFRAGFNVALLAFPQGMAYAFIAGLPIQYGIYGSAIAAIVGALFAGSHFIMLGPTNATSVMLLSAFSVMGVTAAEKLQMLPLLLVLVGLLLVVGAYLRVANLIQYISRTVVTGYITAAAALILANQVKNILGFSFDKPATTFYAIVDQTIRHLPDTQWAAVVIATLTAVVFFVLQKFFRNLPNVAITLVAMSIIGYALGQIPGFEFMTFPGVQAADWKITLPVISFDAISKLASPALAISLLCVLEGTSIGKSIAARAGDRLDANQEMMSIGIANIGCGFFSGMPASGSLTRSVLNWNSGACTPLASIYSGILCAVGAVAIGPLIQYIPRATLAVLITTIGFSLINTHAIKMVLRATRSDAVVFVVTCIAGLLLPLDTAIYYGVAISIMLFLRKAAAPELVEYTFTEEGELAELKNTEERANPEVSIVHVEGNLFFGASDLFRDQIRRVFEDPNLKVVILKMRNAHLLDASSVMALEELIIFMREKNRYLLVSEARKEVIKVFKRSGLLKTLGRENIFPDVATNHTLSTAKALKHTKQLLGGKEANVSIYAKPKPEDRK